MSGWALKWPSFMSGGGGVEKNVSDVRASPWKKSGVIHRVENECFLEAVCALLDVEPCPVQRTTTCFPRAETACSEVATQFVKNVVVKIGLGCASGSV